MIIDNDLTIYGNLTATEGIRDGRTVVSNLGTYYTGGYITSSGTQLYFSVPLANRYNNKVSKITCSFVVRVNGTYALRGQSSVNGVTTSEYTIDLSNANNTLYGVNEAGTVYNIPATVEVTEQGDGNSLRFIIKANSGNYFVKKTNSNAALYNNYPISVKIDINEIKMENVRG